MLTATTVIGQRTKTSLDGREAAEHGYPKDTNTLPAWMLEDKP